MKETRCPESRTVPLPGPKCESQVEGRESTSCGWTPGNQIVTLGHRHIRENLEGLGAGMGENVFFEDAGIGCKQVCNELRIRHVEAAQQSEVCERIRSRT